MTTVRCFVAVRLAENLMRPVIEVVNVLRKTGAGVKWVEPENLHFTLKFLGEISAADVAVAEGAVHRALAGKSRFSISLGGVGAFPSAGSPRVVWLGVTSGAGELRALAADVERELESEGFPGEKRAFSPHLTLGRVRSPGGAGALSPLLSSLKDRATGSMEVSAVHLMRSTLAPKGPVYQPVRSWDLP